jgi:hypothetical protein
MLKNKQLAETEGFEPSVPNSQHDGLANRWFQPLTHVSAYRPRLEPGGERRPIATPMRHGNARNLMTATGTW